MLAYYRNHLLMKSPADRSEIISRPSPYHRPPQKRSVPPRHRNNPSRSHPHPHHSAPPLSSPTQISHRPLRQHAIIRPPPPLIQRTATCRLPRHRIKNPSTLPATQQRHVGHLSLHTDVVIKLFAFIASGPFVQRKVSSPGSVAARRRPFFSSSPSC